MSVLPPFLRTFKSFHFSKSHHIFGETNLKSPLQYQDRIKNKPRQKGSFHEAMATTEIWVNFTNKHDIEIAERKFIYVM